MLRCAAMSRGVSRSLRRGAVAAGAGALLRLTLSAGVPARAGAPAPADVDKRAGDLLARMTLEEKIDYVGGADGFYVRAIPRLGLPGCRPTSRRYFLAAAFLARRCSRYFLIFAFGRSLCFAQTIPNTGAARLEQPGTGHSWIGPLRR